MREKSDMKNAQSGRDKSKLKLVLGIVAALVLLGVIVALIVAMNGNKIAGAISATGETRVGAQQTLTYTVDDAKIKDGERAEWFVDGKKVAENKCSGGQAQLNFVPQHSGETSVKVVVGKYRQTAVLEVHKPLLTFSAQDETITYGETPKLQYTVDGLVGQDTLENLGCDVRCTASGCDVGIYTIDFWGTAPEKYDVQYNQAYLTVLPKEICVAGPIVKTYDQTDLLPQQQLQLLGVVAGDEVFVCADVMFDCKNVGQRTATLTDVEMSGKDCKNYTLICDAQGLIAPKNITLEGLKVADKYYDGTTKAKISVLGSLCGVYRGDSVAVGALEVSFADANVGKQKVDVKNVTLVGVDKDNYRIVDVAAADAEILSAD